jgi:hypothetical protein
MEVMEPHYFADAVIQIRDKGLPALVILNLDPGDEEGPCQSMEPFVNGRHDGGLGE